MVAQQYQQQKTTRKLASSNVDHQENDGYHTESSRRKIKERQSLGLGGKVELFHQALHGTLKLEVSVQFEQPLVLQPYVLLHQQGKEVVLKSLHLVIVLSLEVRQNGDSVVQLKSIGIGRVVDQKHILHRPVQNPQILDEVALVGDEAVLAVKAMVDEVAVRVKEVQYLIGVAGVAGSEDHYLKFALQALEEVNSSRTDVYACVGQLASRKLYGDSEVVLERKALIAVDEGLVEVENDGLLALAARLALQVQYLGFDVILGGHFGVFQGYEYLDAGDQVFPDR